MVDTGRLNLAWGDALAAELAGAGVVDVVLSPGSRSAPLAIGLARHPALRMHVVVDERSAGFVALGLALGSTRPAALVCTSGTAAANYLPAVVEASLARVPLVVFTADRPPELQACGAPQTIRQEGIYGSFVRFAQVLPVPTVSPGALDGARAAIARAVAHAAGPPPGPVHLDVPFREPLVPEGDPGPDEGAGAPPSEPASASPRVRFRAAAGRPARVEVQWLVDALAASRRPILVAGPSAPDPAVGDSVDRFAEAWGVPVLADVASGVRFGRAALSSAEVLARWDAFVEAHRPDLVVRIGAVPTSKAVRKLVEAAGDARHVVLDNAASYRGPSSSRATVLRCEVAPMLDEASTMAPSRADRTWLLAWSASDARAAAVLSTALRDVDGPSGAHAAREVARALRSGGGHGALFAASSMAIRDLDSFAGGGPGPTVSVANRGANGIDGTVSTAAGVAAALGPTVAVVGDLAFLHDAGGLWAAATLGARLDVVVVDDGGGSIFRYLPVAACPGVDLERLFVAPHGLDLGRIAAAFGAEVVRASSAADVRRVLGTPAAGVRVVVLGVDGAGNHARHVRIWERVAFALGAAPIGPGPAPSVTDAFDPVEVACRWGSMRGWIHGRGRHRVVVLHGFAGGADHFRPLARALADDATFLALDLPGHGASDAPYAASALDGTEFVDDLARAADRCGFDRACWLGYSMGGRLALQVAVHHPGACDALVLLGASPGTAPGDARDARRAEDEEWARLAESSGVARFLENWQARPLFASLAALGPAARAADGEVRKACRPEGLAACLRALGPAQLPYLGERLAEVSVPALLVAGELDPKFVEIHAAMEDLLPLARAAVVPGAGHAVFLERPEEVWRRVAGFLRGLPCPSGGVA